MPRFPERSPHAAALPAGTFSLFGPRLRQLQARGDLIPLHLGDTWKQPPADALAALPHRLGPEAHRYHLTPGLPALRERLALCHGVEAHQVFITSGGTGALSVGCRVLFQPPDEVLLLTPSWPLIFGILHGMGATPVEVDFLGADGSELLRRLDAAATERTAGLYLSSPNNPTGRVWTRDELARILDLAVSRGWWVVVDEAYRDLTFGAEQVNPIHLPGGSERVLCACSFSKSYALAGHRVGYLVAPMAMASEAERMLKHTGYHTARASQELALAALDAPASYLEDLCRTYAEAAALAGSLLDLPHPEPQGGYYYFLDASRLCADRAATTQLLSDALEAGVSLAPGWAFGSGFDTWFRLCFTAVPLHRLKQGLQRLQPLLV